MTEDNRRTSKQSHRMKFLIMSRAYKMCYVISCVICSLAVADYVKTILVKGMISAKSNLYLTNGKQAWLGKPYVCKISIRYSLDNKTVFQTSQLKT